MTEAPTPTTMSTTKTEGQRTLKGYRLLPATTARIEELSTLWDCSAQEVIDRAVRGIRAAKPAEFRPAPTITARGVARAAVAIAAHGELVELALGGALLDAQVDAPVARVATSEKIVLAAADRQ